MMMDTLREEGVDEDGGTEESKGESLVTTELVLDISGEDDTLCVSQLLLRGLELTAFEPDCAERLPNLQTLSLSHNKFATLERFDRFGALTELNLNFNQICSLDGLEAPLLAKLYLSNNRLSDGALVGFSRRFPKLHTLCLYRNMFGDLSDALACIRQLPKLRELDLDGNGAATASGYRHHVVRALGRLESLDGEPVSELDRDLADHFFSNAGGGAAGNANRPSTAPDGGRRACPGAGASVDGGAAGAGGGADASTAEFDWSELPKGDVRLVGSKGLNSNPVMITYVAEQLLANPTSSASDDLSALRRLHEEKDESTKKAKAQMQPRPPPGSSLAADRSPQRQRPSTAAARSGDNFVHRLRRSAEVHQDGGEAGGGGGGGSVDILTLEGSPVRPAAGAADAHPGSPFDAAEDADAVDSYGHAKLGGTVAEALAGEKADAVRSGAGAGAGAGGVPPGRITGSASGADLSDPYAIIRRLVKMVEVLKQERDDANDSARAAGVGDDGRATRDITMLQRELTEMRIENANMFVLQEENRQLKEQAEKVTLDMDELKLLREENKELQVQLNDASQQLQALHLSHMLAPSGSAAGSAMQTAMHSAVYDAMPGSSHGRSLYQDPGAARPQTAAEVLDDAEDEMDAEVAALFARNEHTLKQLREDVKAVEQEMVDAVDHDGAQAHALAAEAEGAARSLSKNDMAAPPPRRKKSSSSSSSGTSKSKTGKIKRSKSKERTQSHERSRSRTPPPVTTADVWSADTDDSAMSSAAGPATGSPASPSTSRPGTASSREEPLSITELLAVRKNPGTGRPGSSASQRSGGGGSRPGSRAGSSRPGSSRPGSSRSEAEGSALGAGAGWGEMDDVRGSWSRPRTGEDVDEDAPSRTQPQPLRQRRPLSSSMNQPSATSANPTLKRDPKRGSSSKLHGMSRAGSLTSLAKPESLERGDVVTVHSPRHAAEIVSTSEHGLGDRWWE